MKVSLYIDDDVWKRFRRRVLLERGELKGLSSEVQELIVESSVEELLGKGFDQLGVDVKPLSSSKVVSVKPTVETSSAMVIRKMRDRSRFG